MSATIKIALSLLLSASVAQVYAQGAATSSTKPATAKAPVRKVVPKGPPPIKNEISVGYRLTSDGWGAYVDYGTAKFSNPKQADLFYDVHVLQLEFSEKKHPMQEKTIVKDASTDEELGRYYYGKINNFYALKLGYGFRKMLAGKPDPGSVSIHWTNIIGGSLGMLKPYYFTLWSEKNIKYSEDDRSFPSIDDIRTAAGFSEGLGQMKMVPGGQLKSLLHFDFAASRKTVTAIETGIALEYYAQPITIMYNREPQKLFANLFISLQFGKRW